MPSSNSTKNLAPILLNKLIDIYLLDWELFRFVGKCCPLYCIDLFILFLWRQFPEFNQSKGLRTFQKYTQTSSIIIQLMRFLFCVSGPFNVTFSTGHRIALNMWINNDSLLPKRKQNTKNETRNRKREENNQKMKKTKYAKA